MPLFDYLKPLSEQDPYGEQTYGPKTKEESERERSPISDTVAEWRKYAENDSIQDDPALGAPSRTSTRSVLDNLPVHERPEQPEIAFARPEIDTGPAPIQSSYDDDDDDTAQSRVRPQRVEPVQPLAGPLYPNGASSPIQPQIGPQPDARRWARLAGADEPEEDLSRFGAVTGPQDTNLVGQPLQPGGGMAFGPTLWGGAQQGIEQGAQWLGNKAQDVANSPFGQGVGRIMGEVAAGERSGQYLPDGEYENWLKEQPAYRAAQMAEEDRARAWGEGETALGQFGRQIGNAGMNIVRYGLEVPGKSLASTPADELGNLFTGGDVSERGNMLTPGQFLAPIGEVANRTINPIAIATGQVEPFTYEGDDAATRMLGPFSPYGFKQVADFVTAEWDRYNALNEQITATEKVDPDAGFARWMSSSGVDRAQATLDTILNQDSEVQRLSQQAQEALDRGDMLRAAQLGAEANELSNMSSLQIAESNMNVWAEIMEGIVLDPLNVVDAAIAQPLIEGALKTREASKLRKLFNIDAKTAEKAIAEALDDAAPILKELEQWGGLAAKADGKAPKAGGQFALKAGDSPVDVRGRTGSLNPFREGSVFEKGWNPFARTAESQAKIDTHWLREGAANILKGVTDKGQAQAIIGTWLRDPLELVNQGISSPGVVGNAEIAKRYPILKAAEERLLNMRSLADDAEWNPIAFVAELDEVLYRTAKTFYGGAERPGIVKAASKPSDIARMFMSDVFLALSPRNWLRNAAGATTMLFGADANILKPTREIVDDLTFKFGGTLPIERLFEIQSQASQLTGASETSTGLIDWIAKSVSRNPDNPVSLAMRKAYGIPYGTTELGNIPIGEQAFYARAFHSGYSRFLESEWKQVAEGLQPMLQQLGVDPQMQRSLIDVVAEAGIYGNKDLMDTAIRESVNNRYVPFTLSRLGVPAELLNSPNWKMINDAFRNGSPENVDDVIKIVGDAFDAQRTPIARTMADWRMSPQLKVRWTDMENTNLTAQIIRDAQEAARRAGLDPQQVAAEATMAADRVARTTKQSFSRFRSDLANALGQNNNPDLWNIAMDFWGEVHARQSFARQASNKAGTNAVQLDTPEAWLNKWQTNQKVWGEYAESVAAISDRYRQRLGRVLQGEEYQSAFDWMGVVQKYADFDESEFQSLRQVELGSPSAVDTETFEQIRDMSRQYVDNEAALLFEMFRQFPTMDNYDILVESVQTAHQWGAITGARLSVERDKLVANQITKRQYHATKNRAWRKYYDDVGTFLESMGKVVASNGLSEQVASGLRWTDDFAGGEFQLLHPLPDGFWAARRLDDGTEHKFAGPVRRKPNAVATMPEVPIEVLNDYYRATEQSDQIVEEVVQQAQEVIRQSPPQRRQPRRPLYREREPRVGGIPKQQPERRQVPARIVDDYGDTAIRREYQRPGLTERGRYDLTDEAIGPQEPPRPPTLPKRDADAMEDDLVVRRQTRQGMRAQYDGVAAEFDNMPSLDRVAQMFRRHDTDGTPDMRFRNGELWSESATFREFLEKFPHADDYDEFTRWVAQYIENTDAIKDAERELALSTKRFSRMGASKIIDKALEENSLDAETAEQLRTALKNKEIDRRGILDYIEGLEDLDTDFGMNYYELSFPDAVQLLGLDKDDATPLWTRLAEMVRRNKQKGGEVGLDVADMTDHTVRNLDYWESRIKQQVPQILGGSPNSLNETQKLRIIDGVNDLLQQYDNVLQMSVMAGKNTGDFAMLNFADRRNGDTLLAMVFPYHYFWSRMPSRIAQVAVSKPAMVNAYWEMQRGVNIENQQQNLPDRLQGSIPNILPKQARDALPGWVPLSQERLANPLTYFVPASMYYEPNPFVRPEDATNDLERWSMNLQRWTPGAFPHLQITQDAMMDRMDPLPDGEKRTSKYQVGDFMPHLRAGAYTLSAMTGEQPNAQLGDEYDPYRFTREASTIGTEEGIDPVIVQYAQQFIINQANGVDAMQGIPQRHQQAVQELATRSVQSASRDRSAAALGGLVTGIPGYGYPEGEQQNRATQEEYFNLGYDEATNRYGSKEAQREYLDENAQLSPFWSKSAGIPGYDGIMPADSARNEEKNRETEPIYERMNQAVDTFAREQDPTARQSASGEMYAMKKPYYAEADAVKEKYAPLPEFGAASTSSMRPEERAQKMIDDILGGFPGKPEHPGDNATPEQMDSYYADKNSWDAERLAWVESELAQASRPNDVSTLSFDIATLLEGKDVSDLIFEYDNRNDSEGEKEYVKARADYFAGQRKQMVDMFGEDAVKAYEDKPAYDPDNPEPYASYMDAHPGAATVGIWRNGIGGDDTHYDDGKDYNEAIDKFGPDIWELYQNYPFDGSKAQKSDYYDKYPVMNDFWAWYYDKKGEESQARSGASTGTGSGTGSGVRTDGTGKTWGAYWEEYKAFGDDTAAKAAYLRDNPEFADYYATNYSEGERWWEEYNPGSGNRNYSRYYSGGGSRSYTNYSAGWSSSGHEPGEGPYKPPTGRIGPPQLPQMPYNLTMGAQGIREWRPRRIEDQWRQTGEEFLRTVRR